MQRLALTGQVDIKRRSLSKSPTKARGRPEPVVNWANFGKRCEGHEQAAYPALVLLVDVLRQVPAVCVLHGHGQVVLRQEDLPQLDDVRVHAAHPLVLRTHRSGHIRAQLRIRPATTGRPMLACHVPPLTIWGPRSRRVM